MKIKYCVVCENTPEELEVRVNLKLMDGWELHGGISTAFDDVIIFTQAMVYREETK